MSMLVLQRSGNLQELGQHRISCPVLHLCLHRKVLFHYERDAVVVIARCPE
jgi:hypothetical protein